MPRPHRFTPAPPRRQRRRSADRHAPQGTRSGLKRNNTTKHPPAITTQPANASVAAGALASFTAAASGNPTPEVQWQRTTTHGKTWANVAGANSGTYSFVTTAAETGYEFRALYINSLGRVYSNAATLTVAAGTASAPTITAQPSSLVVVKNTVVAFTAAATGYPAPTVQWQSSTNGGSTWSNVSGATSTTYQFAAQTADNGFEYRAVFANASGSTASNGATLTVSSGSGRHDRRADDHDQPHQLHGGGRRHGIAQRRSDGQPDPTVQWARSRPTRAPAGPT